jgi:hypothetical protein
MPYPISTPGQDSTSGNSKRWPAFPGIPIFLETHDERKAPKTYGTTPTTPTTPEIAIQSQHTPSSQAYLSAPDVSPVGTSPTTTIQTSSARSSVWPIPEPPLEIQSGQSRRPTLLFFPTQRPRVRLDGMPTLQIPQLNEKTTVNEKTPINVPAPGLGIVDGPPKPPSIEITAPVNEKSDDSCNFAQRIEEKLWKYRESDNILKRWLLEVLSWIFSAICMGAIIGVLIYLQGDSLSRWTIQEKTHLTLNAYISILSKMAGAALILPVSEALGQLKWSWFLEHSKQMWDFEIFDNASRGPWGSFLLLIRTKGKALAALGALIMLASLTLDPFFQQVVDFPERPSLHVLPGAIPRVLQYSPPYRPEYYQGWEENQIDQQLEYVVQSYLYANGTQPTVFGNGTRPDIPLSCPTSNCSWPDYETLAVCSTCSSVDVADIMTFACLNTTIDWTITYTGIVLDDAKTTPNGTACGYFINATSTAPILMSGYVFNETDVGNEFGEALLVRTLPLTKFLTKDQLYGAGSINFKDIRNPLLDALIVSAVDGVGSVYRHIAPVVHECVVSWCVETIRSSYEGGKYGEEILSTYKNLTAGPWPWASFDIPEDEGGGTFIYYDQNVTLTPPSTNYGRHNGTVFNDTYGTSNISSVAVLSIFDDFFPSYYTAPSVSGTPTLRYKDFHDGAKTRQLPFNPWLAPNNLTSHLERMARAMTNVVRSDIDSNEMLRGEAFSMENYVEVRWQWLTLPLCVLFVSLIFLAATITKSALERDRVGVWKTSAYATLLYGLPEELRKKITRSSSTGTPRSKAKEMKVKLQPNQGWRISEAIFSPFTPKPKLNQPPPGWI